MTEAVETVWTCDGCEATATLAGEPGQRPAGWLTVTLSYTVTSAVDGVDRWYEETRTFHAVEPCLNEWARRQISLVAATGVNVGSDGPSPQPKGQA